MSDSIYQHKANAISGEEISFDQYKGKVLLIVNTASKCGFTPQFMGLEELYQQHKEKDFEILFCQKNYGVSFQMFEKIEVNGDGAHPLYKFLKKEKGGFLISKIKWNFTKFLVDKNGEVKERFAPTTTPEKIGGKVQKLLGA